ncbi:MAG: S9 family peptidase [Actinobacteria bacterium]|nr:S9 family peptidase [Actinomycetota bacterium]
MSDAGATEPWEQRFRARLTYLPEWSPHAPDRVVYTSNEAVVWQVHAWDLATGLRRQVTDHPVGLLDGVPTLDGEGVLWFQDETGDESGRWLVQPFHGGETRPFLDGVPHGWNEGLAQAPGIVVAGISGRDGFAIYVSLDGAAAREIQRSSESVQIGGAEGEGFVRGGLSSDGLLLCLEHAEHGDLIHPALRVIDPRLGETAGELIDEGMSLHARCWSPVAGDQRLAFEHELAGDERPGIWDLATGERTNLALELEGGASPQDWWPDGSALLLQNTFEGRSRLYRYELASGSLDPIPSEPGYVWKARVRPDGRVWFLHEQGHRQRLVFDDKGSELLPPEDGFGPAGRPYQSWHFENLDGQRVHGFFVTPDDSGGPFPVLMFVHGGPTWLDLDRWQPEVQAYVDAGFAVGMVNYRGSIGYGREWRDTLIGNIGGPELEDVNAGLRDLVERGIADPGRAVVAGHSWGGYVTLLELGKHPELWACGVAGVPVGDYADGYEELSPLLQAYDRALLGGCEPKDVPELMRDRNAINFADDVRVPVLFIIGRNDSRCPYRQAMRYVEKLAARDHPHEVYVFETGHGSFDVDERVRQVSKVLDFLARHVPGVRAAAVV